MSTANAKLAPGRNQRHLGRVAAPGTASLAAASAAGKPTFGVDSLAHAGLTKIVVSHPRNSRIFSQGDAADAVFYIQKGQVRISVVSPQGKEATVALLDHGEFTGEECFSSPVRLVTATALTECTLLKISRQEIVRALGEGHAFSDVFVSFLLARIARIQEDLIDQLFNSSEKRLARVLLLLARFGKEGQPETVIPKFSQAFLAEMIGTTRSRVSFFMNRFREKGYIEYNGHLKVHSTLLNVVLHDNERPL